MLRDLRISGFRGLREFAMTGLGRVNLLVGTNNCGKSSVLEAIHALVAASDPSPLWEAQLRRGELVEGSTERQTDVAHLFFGHQFRNGIRFSVEGSGPTGPRAFGVRAYVRDAGAKDANGDGEDMTPQDDTPRQASAYIRLDWLGSPRAPLRLPLTRNGGLRERRVRMPRLGVEVEPQNTVSLITTEGLSRENVTAMFGAVALTPGEKLVLQALQTIEPEIERIALVGTYTTPSAVREPTHDARGGLAMMVGGQRIPIGSMGDGIWRLLGIALSLVRARGGVLLVDEIDTGLHYSVLVDMWRLVLETARSLDVQVFATTHSRDCYEALAAITEPGRNEISLQRIERGKVDAVAFSELEIKQAADRGLEVR